MPLLSLKFPTSNTAGTALAVKHLMPEKSVQVEGTFTATFRIQGSNNNTAWADLTTDITAAGIYSLPQAVQYIRVNCSAFTSAPTCTVCGYGPGYTP